MAKRLWDKGDAINEHVHHFTVGNDPQLDQLLVPWDLLGSAAHARMLCSIDILSEDECGQLISGLLQIRELHAQGQFEIPSELEDCHTAIETHLSEHLGDAGKKIHTGRSRNDQVLVASRLYMRSELLDTLLSLAILADTFLQRAEEMQDIPMPGYTHFQPAMPSSVAMWLHATAEALLDLCKEGLTLYERINCNPLGAGSGFGTSLPLDRELTAKLLGFSRVQRSPIDVTTARGRYELKFVRWCSDIASVIEKFATDMVLWSSAEYAFFSLPIEFTTGSSIMPQKRNPDVAELLRARAGKLRAAETEISWVIGKLPSNYHRDHQYTKEPLIRAAWQMAEILPICQAVAAGFSANSSQLEKAMSTELYATYAAYRLVKEGKPFREAYVEAAKSLADGELSKEDLAKDFQIIAETTASDMASCRSELQQVEADIAAIRTSLDETLGKLLSA